VGHHRDGRDQRTGGGRAVTPWLRRNRGGLLALPITVALAVGANAQRLPEYWWNDDLRSPAATGVPGDWLTWTDSFDDSAGTGTRTFRVKVTGTQSVTEPAGVALPPELAAWRVTLDFQAAPNQVLYGCSLALRDDQGNRYDYHAAVDHIVQDDWPCLPGERVGPRPSLTPGRPREALFGEARPTHWTTRPIVLAPRSAHITEVLMWWEQPDYVVVRLD
jgi:hypothetical protein